MHYNDQNILGAKILKGRIRSKSEKLWLITGKSNHNEKLILDLIEQYAPKSISIE